GSAGQADWGYSTTTTTSQSSDDEIETFYEEITSILEQEQTHHAMITGDFNAKFGKNAAGESST
ncbi:hypothetical protein, partial [Klebsiella pneumoniae]|uniref:hypothetical protein n=1 Tax=Klebsiella pneumoniae TaxID=573 RepID=UPI003EBBDDE0